MVDELYFNWLLSQLTSPPATHQKLMLYLYQTPYVYVQSDENCAVHGMDLRRIYFQRTGLVANISGGPVMLELLIALAMQMENIVSDPGRGDRTSQWFWSMLINLGLGTMSDDRFNENVTQSQLQIFMTRAYQTDGSGGNLFIIKNSDIRNMPLWVQLCWYLNEKG